MVIATGCSAQHGAYDEKERQERPSRASLDGAMEGTPRREDPEHKDFAWPVGQKPAPSTTSRLSAFFEDKSTRKPDLAAAMPRIFWPRPQRRRRTRRRDPARSAAPPPHPCQAAETSSGPVATPVPGAGKTRSGAAALVAKSRNVLRRGRRTRAARGFHVYERGNAPRPSRARRAIWAGRAAQGLPPMQ